MNSIEKKLSEIYIYREEKAQIIESFTSIINTFKEKYPEEFLLRILLNSNYSLAIHKRIVQFKALYKIPSYELLNKDKVLLDLKEERRQKQKIIRLIYDIAKKHNKFTFNHILKFFNIFVDLRDFALGGTLYDIERKNRVRSYYLKSIADLVFTDRTLYRRRIYHSRYLTDDILEIAHNVINGKILNSNFANLTSPYIQELLHRYRKKKYRTIGTSLFNRFFLEHDFTKRIYNMPQSKLDHIFADFDKKVNRNELLIMCAQINKNLEILQFIIYNLLKSTPDFVYLSEVSGKSINFINKCKKLLNDYNI